MSINEEGIPRILQEIASQSYLATRWLFNIIVRLVDACYNGEFWRNSCKVEDVTPPTPVCRVYPGDGGSGRMLGFSGGQRS
ncbi:MAG: hypothetical protein IPK94_07220 [Saprospiraceae bacterium]|nr:hypothetical protein [Saprospiraceae bacterium]